MFWFLTLCTIYLSVSLCLIVCFTPTHGPRERDEIEPSKCEAVIMRFERRERSVIIFSNNITHYYVVGVFNVVQINAKRH